MPSAISMDVYGKSLQQTSSSNRKMAVDMKTRGSASRIKNCAFELLSSWDDLIMDDYYDEEENVLWDPMEDDVGDDYGWLDLMQRDIRLKSTFFYCDFNQMISATPHHDQKKSLTLLANRLLSSIQELDRTTSVGCIHLIQDRYSDVALVLKDVIALMP
ncbi:photosynthetic NDH subunit of lumenal location 3, chloroplastic-like [Malania oleifera]|uniref:photosynthetic NDH subunit of lumenal location 3, chloroplastic-like n=1 Tax=Malania oleifera TaxID=397392 RepID=UPI0025AE8729|nr:photosynthetic NDH subunit of lumenal location 3, chloroplastic-like [Malania oleifera]